MSRTYDEIVRRREVNRYFDGGGNERRSQRNKNKNPVNYNEDALADAPWRMQAQDCKQFLCDADDDDSSCDERTWRPDQMCRDRGKEYCAFFDNSKTPPESITNLDNPDAIKANPNIVGVCTNREEEKKDAEEEDLDIPGLERGEVHTIIVKMHGKRPVRIEGDVLETNDDVDLPHNSVRVDPRKFDAAVAAMTEEDAAAKYYSTDPTGKTLTISYTTGTPPPETTELIKEEFMCDEWKVVAVDESEKPAILEGYIRDAGGDKVRLLGDARVRGMLDVLGIVPDSKESFQGVVDRMRARTSALRDITITGPPLDDPDNFIFNVDNDLDETIKVYDAQYLAHGKYKVTTSIPINELNPGAVVHVDEECQNLKRDMERRFKTGVWPVGTIYKADPPGKEMVQCKTNGKWYLRDESVWTVDGIVKQIDDDSPEESRAIITILGGPPLHEVVGHQMILADDEKVKVYEAEKAEIGENRYHVTTSVPTQSVEREQKVYFNVEPDFVCSDDAQDISVGSFVIIPNVVDEEDEYRPTEDGYDDEAAFDDAFDDDEDAKCAAFKEEGQCKENQRCFWDKNRCIVHDPIVHGPVAELEDADAEEWVRYKDDKQHQLHGWGKIINEDEEERKARVQREGVVSGAGRYAYMGREKVRIIKENDKAEDNYQVQSVKEPETVYDAVIKRAKIFDVVVVEFPLKLDRKTGKRNRWTGDVREAQLFWEDDEDWRQDMKEVQEKGFEGEDKRGEKGANCSKKKPCRRGLVCDEETAKCEISRKRTKTSLYNPNPYASKGVILKGKQNKYYGTSIGFNDNLEDESKLEIDNHPDNVKRGKAKTLTVTVKPQHNIYWRKKGDLFVVGQVAFDKLAGFDDDRDKDGYEEEGEFDWLRFGATVRIQEDYHEDVNDNQIFFVLEVKDKKALLVPQQIRNRKEYETDIWLTHEHDTAGKTLEDIATEIETDIAKEQGKQLERSKKQWKKKITKRLIKLRELNSHLLTLTTTVPAKRKVTCYFQDGDPVTATHKDPRPFGDFLKHCLKTKQLSERDIEIAQRENPDLVPTNTPLTATDVVYTGRYQDKYRGVIPESPPSGMVYRVKTSETKDENMVQLHVRWVEDGDNLDIGQIHQTEKEDGWVATLSNYYYGDNAPDDVEVDSLHGEVRLSLKWYPFESLLDERVTEDTMISWVPDEAQTHNRYFRLNKLHERYMQLTVTDPDGTIHENLTMQQYLDKMISQWRKVRKWKVELPADKTKVFIMRFDDENIVETEYGETYKFDKVYFGSSGEDNLFNYGITDSKGREQSVLLPSSVRDAFFNAGQVEEGFEDSSYVADTTQLLLTNKPHEQMMSQGGDEDSREEDNSAEDVAGENLGEWEDGQEASSSDSDSSSDSEEEEEEDELTGGGRWIAAGGMHRYIRTHGLPQRSTARKWQRNISGNNKLSNQARALLRVWEGT